MGFKITFHAFIRYLERVKGVINKQQAQSFLDEVENGTNTKNDIMKKLSKDHYIKPRKVYREIKKDLNKAILKEIKGKTEKRKYNGCLYICCNENNTNYLITVLNKRKF